MTEEESIDWKVDLLQTSGTEGRSKGSQRTDRISTNSRCLQGPVDPDKMSSSCWTREASFAVVDTFEGGLWSSLYGLLFGKLEEALFNYSDDPPLGLSNARGMFFHPSQVFSGQWAPQVV